MTEPFPDTMRIDFEGNFVPSFTGPDNPQGDGWVMQGRLYAPLGARWMFRGETGYGSAPDGAGGARVTGLDETTVQAFYRFDWRAGFDILLGPQITDPGKTDPALGAAPLRVGLAQGFYDKRRERFQWGWLGSLTVETEQAGDGKQGVIGTLQPLGIWVLPNGWYTSAQPTGSYDFERDVLYIPGSIRTGRVFETDRTVYDLWFEPEVNVYSNDAIFPEFQPRFCVNIRYK